VNGTRIIATARRIYGERIVASMGEGNRIVAPGSGVTAEDVRRQFKSMYSAGHITEVQLHPPQLIVAGDEGEFYRVPFRIKGGAITFGEPVAVEIQYVAAKTAAAADGRKTMRTGWITPQRAGQMAASFRRTMSPRKAEEQIAVLRLLTDTPVRASAPAPGDDDPIQNDPEFGHLWPPRTREEAGRRRELAEHIAASNAAAAEDLDEDEEYDAFIAAHWPPS
jgi:hypothetical protein